MRQLMLAAAAAVALAAPAHAADMMADATYDWSGFSAGVFGGGEWSNFDQTELYTNAFGGGWWFPPGPNPGYDYSDKSFMGGVQLGWDYQSGNIVTGLGVEVGTMNINVTKADPNSPVIPIEGPTGPVTDLDGKMFGSLTGRVGIASDRFLGYVRGGVSILDADAKTVDACARSFCGQLTIKAKESTPLLGVTAGAGFDYAITDQITLGAEYRLYAFESMKVSGIASNLERYHQTIDPDLIHTVRLNLNFRF